MKLSAALALSALLLAPACGARKSIRKGDSLLEAGRTSAALNAYEDALERSPDDPEIHLRVARIQLDRWEVERALPHARFAAAADLEGSAEVLGRALLMAGQPQQALTLASEALADAPTPEHYLILAEAQLSTGDPEAALASSRRAANGGAPEAISLRAYLLARNGRPAHAIEQATQAQIAAPKDSDVQAEAAVVYILLGESASAQGAAQEALYYNDDHAERWARGADLRHEQGDVEGAIRYAMRVHALDPNNAATAWALGVWWLEVGEPGWAISMLDLALNLPPYDDPLATVRDPELQKLTLTERREGRVQIALALSEAYGALGDRQRQIEALRVAVEDARDAALLFRLARLYEQAGMPSEFLEAAKAACEQDPGLTEAAITVVQIYGAAGMFDDALAYALPALKRAPGQPTLSRMIAEIYEARGEFSLALETLEIALRNNPGEPALKAARDRVAERSRRPW